MMVKQTLANYISMPVYDIRDTWTEYIRLSKSTSRRKTGQGDLVAAMQTRAAAGAEAARHRERRLGGLGSRAPTASQY